LFFGEQLYANWKISNQDISRVFLSGILIFRTMLFIVIQSGIIILLWRGQQEEQGIPTALTRLTSSFRYQTLMASRQVGKISTVGKICRSGNSIGLPS
jgi:hypothetical protein